MQVKRKQLEKFAEIFKGEITEQRKPLYPALEQFCRQCLGHLICFNRDCAIGCGEAGTGDDQNQFLFGQHEL